MKKYKHQIYGFTRLDMLVCVAMFIMLLLLAIALHKNLYVANEENVCRMNMKNITKHILDYVLENEQFPAAADSHNILKNDWIYWQNNRRLEDSAVKLDKDIKKLVCPLDKNYRYRSYPFSYTMNPNLSQLPLNKLIIKNDLIILFEENHPNSGACESIRTLQGLAYRHRNKTLVGQFDGSVKALTLREAYNPELSMPLTK